MEFEMLIGVDWSGLFTESVKHSIAMALPGRQEHKTESLEQHLPLSDELTNSIERHCSHSSKLLENKATVDQYSFVAF